MSPGNLMYTWVLGLTPDQYTTLLCGKWQLSLLNSELMRLAGSGASQPYLRLSLTLDSVPSDNSWLIAGSGTVSLAVLVTEE
jgi:hypothetical protein